MFNRKLKPILGLILGVVLVVLASAWTASATNKNFEVWLVDQSNSPELSYGGKIYIYEGSNLMGKNLDKVKPASVIDVSAETSQMCLNETGANPVRPHMLLFNSNNSHAILSFVASGHVVIYDAAKQTPVACIRTTPGVDGITQAHAAFPSPDNSYILLANQNGKLLERIDTDYKNNSYTLNTNSTLNLATCVTANNVACQLANVRPDNAPICPIIPDSSSDLVFVTLRGGGMFVVDPKSNPISILAEYDMKTVKGNGCGGVEAKGNMYMNSGGGTSGQLYGFDIYRFPLKNYKQSNPVNTPRPLVTFADNSAGRDSHGMTVTNQDRFVWVADRGQKKIEMISVDSDQRVNTIDLIASGDIKPTPDLLDISPSGNRVFMSLRGPTPLSADPHVSLGPIPGLGVIQVSQNGRNGTLAGIIPISNMGADKVEHADAHAIRVRIK